jgi:NADH:ubiquinone oxidoreductase subunit 3 (subunit A)
MITLQSLFIVLLILLLCYLVVDGLLTRSVWIKGGRKKPFSFRQWAYKCDHEDEPRSYWFAIGFYTVAILLLIWLLLSGPAT